MKKKYFWSTFLAKGLYFTQRTRNNDKRLWYISYTPKTVIFVWPGNHHRGKQQPCAVSVGLMIVFSLFWGLREWRKGHKCCHGIEICAETRFFTKWIHTVCVEFLSTVSWADGKKGSVVVHYCAGYHCPCERTPFQCYIVYFVCPQLHSGRCVHGSLCVYVCAHRGVHMRVFSDAWSV